MNRQPCECCNWPETRERDCEEEDYIHHPDCPKGHELKEVFRITLQDNQWMVFENSQDMKQELWGMIDADMLPVKVEKVKLTVNEIDSMEEGYEWN